MAQYDHHPVTISDICEYGRIHRTTLRVLRSALLVALIVVLVL